MRSIKTVLFCGAALASLSLQAQADDLSALKHEIEQLNSRLAQLEAAPALPADAALVTISKGAAPIVPGLAETDPGYGDVATVISVLPTADAPATTTITWTGYARAGVVFVDNKDADNDLDVKARGEIKVVGETDTSVGKVGALVKIRGDFNGLGVADAYIKEAWGWWALTPELTLGGGYSGTLGNIGYGYDGGCTCYYTDNANLSLDPGDSTQLRLTYASGPLTVAVALEDGSTDSDATLPSELGGSAEVKYSGDIVSGEISGIWLSGDDTNEDYYQIGAGVGFTLASTVVVSLAAGTGQTHDGEDYWIASGLASINLTDSAHAEIAYGHSDGDDSGTTDAVLAGLYYDPVSQLTVGLEGEWIKDYSTQLDLVTVFRF